MNVSDTLKIANVSDTSKIKIANVSDTLKIMTAFQYNHSFGFQKPMKVKVVK